MRCLVAVVTSAVLASGVAAAGELKFSAKAYADLSYRQNVDEGKNTTSADSGTGVDVKRFYFGADYTLNDVWSAKFLTDIGDKGAKRYDVFVKNAYLQAKFHPLFAVRLGAAPLAWTPLVEDRYGFRYVEKVLIDRVGFGDTADWGVHILGNYKELFAYQVSVINGRGFSDPTRSKNPSLEARVSTSPIPGLNFGLGGEVGKLGQQVEGTPAPNTARRLDALIGYERPLFRVGVEGFLAKDFNANIVLGKSPEDSERGLSAFGNLNFTPQLSLFARYDHVQPNQDTNPDVKNQYFNVGIQFLPISAVNLALVYKRETVSSGSLAKGVTLTTSNGTIGSSKPNNEGRFQEIGLFTQFVY